MIKRVILPSLLMLLLFNVSFAVTAEPVEQEQAQTFSPEDISAFEKKFKEIDVYIDYLKAKMVEHNDIISMYTEAERLFRDLKTSPDIKDIELSRQHLKLKLEILEEKAEQKVSYIKRMDFMYQAMLILGMTMIIFMVVYSIYMYARRK